MSEEDQHSERLNSEEDIKTDTAAGLVTVLETSIQDIFGENIPAKTNSTSEDPSYDLDKIYNEKIDKTNGITSEIVNVQLKYSALWNKKMDRYYSLLVKKIDEEGKAYSLIRKQNGKNTVKRITN